MISKKKIQPELRKRWLAALRSGKYKQGHGALHTDTAGKQHRYCCLGVACEVFNDMCKEGVLGLKKKDLLIVENEYGTHSYQGNDISLPATLTPLINGSKTTHINLLTDVDVLRVVKGLKDRKTPMKLKGALSSKSTLELLQVKGPCEQSRDTEGVLAGLNDSGLFSFKKIANIIERSTTLQ